jgi:hypothetical protein
MSDTERVSMLDAALAYAARGLAVFPVYEITPGGRCTCGRACGSPGKHPRTLHGAKDATTDEAKIRAWWRRWANSNIGVATGTASGVVVLDADGSEGLESLKALDTHATTWLAKTARGYHQWFALPDGLGIGNRAGLMPKLDVRGDGGYVVAPPSLHASGVRYEWLTPPDATSLAPLPKAALILARHWTNGHRGPLPEPGEPIPEGQRNDTLFRLGRSLLVRGLSPEAVQAALDAENESRCAPPLSDTEVATIVENVLAQPHAPEFEARAETLTQAEAEGWAASHRARSTPPPTARGPVLVTLANVQPKRIEYLWPQRVPRGKLVGLMGDPGLGKSLLALNIAARVSAGTPWPDGGVAPQGDVVILSAEDDVADTIYPRAELMGADLKRLHAFQAIRDATGERGVDLSRDVARIEQVVAAKSASLVVIDPIDSYLGGQVDSHKNASVRRVLAPLAALGMKTRVTFLVVMHLNKAEDHRALYRALGSIGYVAAARSVLAVGPDPDDAGRRIMVSAKSNLNAEAAPLAYRVVGACPKCRTLDVGPTCRGCQKDSVAYLEWSGEPVRPVNADELLGAPAVEAGRPGPRQEARDFLLRELRDGNEVEAKVLVDTARDNDISRRTLFRAKAELGVLARLDGQPGTHGQRWLWSLGVTDEEAHQWAEGRRRRTSP